MGTGFNKIWASGFQLDYFVIIFCGFFLGGLCNISRVQNDTSMVVLLCVFGGRDLCFGCNFNLG